jgi:hypothetical protein
MAAAGLVGTTVAGPVLAQESLTIYGDGRVLHRRAFTLTVPAGLSEHRLALGLVDPSSLFSLDSTVTIVGSRFDAAVDEVNTLRRAVGRRITFWTGGTTNGVRDTVVAEVLGVDPERYRTADGRVVFNRPGVPLFPGDVVLAEPSLALTLQSRTTRPGFSLGYFSSGGGWQADYAVVVSGSTARITGNATITAGMLRSDSAQIQLVAGEVGRGATRKEFVTMDRTMAAAPAPMAVSAQEERTGEVHLYSLPGRLSLAPGVAATAMLFEPATAPVERVYTVRGVLPFWGGLPQLPSEVIEPVQVTYVVKRPLKSEFGERPVPNGTARIYQRDSEGRLQLIGESAVGHTAPGQDLRLGAGTAFDLTAQRIQSSFNTRRDSLRTIGTASYRVALANAKDSAVTVDVIEARGGEWSVLSSSVPAEKLSSTETRFRVRVPPRSETTLTYQVRVVW